MQCPRCQHENRTAAKFCEECGESLQQTCGKCGSYVSPNAKFCSQCAHPVRLATESGDVIRLASPDKYTPSHLAEKILVSKGALEGERKLVTVLFADIRGSMELISDRDAEEAQKLLDPVLDHMMAAVHHYEGTVNRVMGDGIMALFGAPLAHEDHAVRACYAALRMQEMVSEYASEVLRVHGVTTAIRVGLNSGEIVIRAIGDDLHMDYIVVGQTANLAARMEQMARPGSVLTTAETVRLAEGYVAFKSLGPVPVKGLADPIEVYEVVGGGPARTRLEAAAQRGLTRFIGREGELGQLRQALDRARNGQAQVVGVVGEPGVGKSRLVHEFVRLHCGESCLVLETNSASYGHARPYLPVIELLKHYFKTEVRDSATSIREKVMATIMGLDATLQDAVPPLLDLLDVLYEEHPFRSLDAQQHRQATYQAITRLLLKESCVQPIVAVFEDLHWSDSLTFGLLNDVVVGTPLARLLLVVTYRPEYRDEWRNRPNYCNLRLTPLASDNLAELLQVLLGAHASLFTLKQMLLERASGNPFFIEETVRVLVDTGLLEGSRGDYLLAKPLLSVQIPPTVQAVIGARIDALGAAEKRLLQEAAVIGHDVPFVLLQKISGLEESELRGLLGTLQSHEFLYTTQLFPDLQYTFKHALTHDVAYAGLLHERRRAIHAHIVEAAEGLFADRLGEQAERLADHALRGQLWKKAVIYLRQAGAKAADRLAFREAVTLFENALQALSHLPESSETLEQTLDIHFDLRNVLQPLGDRDRIASFLREAEKLASRLDDTRRIGWVQSYLTEHFWMLGQYEESAKAGERALAIGERLSDLSLQVVTNLPLGLAYHTRGDYRRAIEIFGWNARHLEGERVRERFGMFVLPSTFSRSFMAWGLAELGEFAKGSAVGEEALRIAETAEHPFSCGYAHLGLGVLSLRHGDVPRALTSLERALADGAFAGSPVGYAYVAFHLGYALALTGKLEEGIKILEETVKVAESKGFVARHALRLAYLSEANMIAGRYPEATALGARALGLAREHDERANQAYAHRILGELDSRCGNAEAAEASFRAALTLAEGLGMRPLAANCHRGLAEILGATQSGTAHRRSASRLAETMQMRFWGDCLVNSTVEG